MASKTGDVVAHEMPTQSIGDNVPNAEDEGSTQDEEMSLALQNYAPGSEEEKKLVRKIDCVLLPCLWWMYVLAYLDRGNVVSTFPLGTLGCDQSSHNID